MILCTVFKTLVIVNSVCMDFGLYFEELLNELCTAVFFVLYASFVLAVDFCRPSTAASTIVVEF